MQEVKNFVNAGTESALLKSLLKIKDRTSYGLYHDSREVISCDVPSFLTKLQRKVSAVADFEPDNVLVSKIKRIDKRFFYDREIEQKIALLVLYGSVALDVKVKKDQVPSSTRTINLKSRSLFIISQRGNGYRISNIERDNFPLSTPLSVILTFRCLEKEQEVIPEMNYSTMTENPTSSPFISPLPYYIVLSRKEIHSEVSRYVFSCPNIDELSIKVLRKLIGFKIFDKEYFLGVCSEASRIRKYLDKYCGYTPKKLYLQLERKIKPKTLNRYKKYIFSTAQGNPIKAEPRESCLRCKKRICYYNLGNQVIVIGQDVSSKLDELIKLGGNLYKWDNKGGMRLHFSSIKKNAVKNFIMTPEARPHYVEYKAKTELSRYFDSTKIDSQATNNENLPHRIYDVVLNGSLWYIKYSSDYQRFHAVTCSLLHKKRHHYSSRLYSELKVLFDERKIVLDDSLFTKKKQQYMLIPENEIHLNTKKRQIELTSFSLFVLIFSTYYISEACTNSTLKKKLETIKIN